MNRMTESEDRWLREREIGERNIKVDCSDGSMGFLNVSRVRKRG
jgi:hypothetical protein